MTTPEQFVQWLDELLKFANPTRLDSLQTFLIKSKLDSVFNKVTPEIKPLKPVDSNTYCARDAGVDFSDFIYSTC